MHETYDRRLAVITPGIHALDAEALFVRQELHIREVGSLLPLGLLHSPIEIVLIHEIRQADERYPPEVLLAGAVNLHSSFLPPFLLILIVNAAA